MGRKSNEKKNRPRRFKQLEGANLPLQMVKSSPRAFRRLVWKALVFGPPQEGVSRTEAKHRRLRREAVVFNSTRIADRGNLRPNWKEQAFG
jgi:hypothetical protein